ncbi:MAG: prepilin-type N-terminal cleavage/methylation domain-containing protein [Candidatus Riflebacteria bacterium]|nr:prepilin-type N-terminal cleavage/methylation domain-containing protein [Candidatus Riflebacteria bacterium]
MRSPGFRGTTLLEVIVAVAILGIGLLPVINVLTTVSRTQRLSQEELAATCWAEEVIEQLQSMPFEAVQPCTDLNLGGIASITPLWPAFPDSIVITRPLPKDMEARLDVFLTESPSLKWMTVRVFWGSGPVHNVTLTAFTEWRL